MRTILTNSVCKPRPGLLGMISQKSAPQRVLSLGSLWRVGRVCSRRLPIALRTFGRKHASLTMATAAGIPSARQKPRPELNFGGNDSIYFSSGHAIEKVGR